ncbi:uncharacterized protein METZ01_LOCUS161649 [marine metagenome]|uniref:Uncharacterized protein n=1 Tax=marine metagenome TaxID=408172 RepID=A0A382B4W1_9ZZZZ
MLKNSTYAANLLHMCYLYKLTAAATRLKLNQKSQPNLANPADKRPGWGRGRSSGHIVGQFF